MARADVMNILYSKNLSPLEFHFEELQSYPLLMYLTIEDIEKLRQIAISARLASKPKEKLRMINEVLLPRNFRKLASGTNRVVYKHLEDQRVVLKVALDRVGLRDNPCEYRNQFYLRPFITKCFEVSPCGTVGLFERVEPIITKDEFISVAEDVFDLLNKFIIGKYILEDIGEKYFQNYGLRKGFGPVLLDYPYMYELDGNKLYCNQPDLTTPSGYCDGLIDYDIGYNNLICTKCGKRYLATELKKYSDNNQIILKNEGDVDMKFSIFRGEQLEATIDSSTTPTKIIEPPRQRRRKPQRELIVSVEKECNPVTLGDDERLREKLYESTSEVSKASNNSDNVNKSFEKLREMYESTYKAKAFNNYDNAKQNPLYKFSPETIEKAMKVVSEKIGMENPIDLNLGKIPKNSLYGEMNNNFGKTLVPENQIQAQSDEEVTAKVEVEVAEPMDIEEAERLEVLEEASNALSNIPDSDNSTEINEETHEDAEEVISSEPDKYSIPYYETAEDAIDSIKKLDLNTTELSKDDNNTDDYSNTEEKVEQIETPVQNTVMEDSIINHNETQYDLKNIIRKPLIINS